MKKATIGLVLTAYAVGAYAAPEVHSVEDRKATIDAQLELIKKQEELDNALRATAARSAKGIPTVISISVVGDTRKALLQLPDGRSEYFKVGDEIQNNVFLGSVDLRKVVAVVRKGKKSIPVALDFAAGSQTGQMAPNAAPGQVQLPPIPASMLPAPPYVQIPSLGRIQGPAAPVQSPAPASGSAQVTPPVPAQ